MFTRSDRSIRLRLALFCSAILLGQSARAVPPTQPSYDQLIDQLASADGHERAAAEKALLAAGKPAREPLTRALDDPRLVVQTSARRLVREINIFLLRGESDEALTFAQAYLNASDSVLRKSYLNQLFQLNPQPAAVLTRLITIEPDEDLRRQMLYQLGTGYRASIPRMLVHDRDLAAVMSVLNQSAEMWGHAEAADDAAALFLTGQIDPQIELCKAEQVNGDTPSREHAATQLCYLYRAMGQFDQALKYARLSRDQGLIFLVLQDQGDWAAAAREPDDRWRDPIVLAAYHSAFQRLAGQSAAAVTTMTQQANLAADDADRSFLPSRLFLLNDMPERGIELLTSQHPAVAFQMRQLRGEIPAALEIADKYRFHPQDQQLLEALKIALWRRLGKAPELTTEISEGDEPPPTAQVLTWRAAMQQFDDHQYLVAADSFGRMWEEKPTDFDRLYMQGLSLVRAGQTDPSQIERGQSLMKQATLLPLGDSVARWRFAGALEAAGLAEVADQQRDFALRTGGEFDDLGFSEIYNTRAARAMARKQWPAAADALDRLCLINLSSQVQWHDSTRLLTVPALAHLVKARDALAHRDIARTMQELTRYQQYLPATTDMALEMVPALDEVDEHASADAIFAAAFNKSAELVALYPASVTYQNQLAWLCACCSRKLDEGLAAAQQAVRLKPNDWQVMDSLAEVHFRRGERTAAIAIESKAAAMTFDLYIARQLKRFQSAAIPSRMRPGAAPQ